MIWTNKSVLITGHTGFKGGWLALWLNRLGAEVHGYSLAPPTEPNLFGVARVGAALASDIRGDLADLARLKTAFSNAAPQVVFHLAAQPLVRESYRDPLGTLVTNVLGTARVLEAVRGCESVRAVVLITTDKVYQNREWAYPYREVDALGGHDPYSASKAAAEVVAASYRASFFSETAGHPARIATARAGNVIGGGDWASDRLVPDCVRAFAEGEPARLRFPGSVRPWQHVLEPLAGYLRLAEQLVQPAGGPLARAWNFGPDAGSDATAGEVAMALARLWGAGARAEAGPDVEQPHEAGLLRLDSTLARSVLGWAPRWTLALALAQTASWYRAWLRGADMTAFCLSQIDDYEAAASP
ncbi:CDP-glucose 4,6-dehydratase [Candidatus Thiodictyon syntrophicum]|jgi:CDP-glucose 4,6-dehydratase|uniref:CDP-glucose 4,6-dehydratase n=1 Tax=Candidatus Thiodictyon syntrophicum TaxID=1166950 RepID=A0A2K8UF23_9GAMM|nr:CDP-glucose 4,6-dehydratase [Candidatus Thiodictyon syntrophicum]AUB84160.1 CDP-glucose 4,6-dehydratase [Candidatus Thiodictyon syntrophicum]